MARHRRARRPGPRPRVAPPDRPDRCLTALERRGRRALPVDVLPDTPATEISWLEPYPSAEEGYLAREDVGLALVARRTEAWHAVDVAAAEWFRGRDDIRTFLLNGPLRWRWRFLPTTGNGRWGPGPAVPDPELGGGVAPQLRAAGDVAGSEPGTPRCSTATAIAEVCRLPMPIFGLR